MSSPFLSNNPGVTVEVFAICWNEAKMLPHFIEHYRKWYNAKITIYDNMSTDESRTIARRADCSVQVYDSSDQIRDDLYVLIKNNCWKRSSAQFVIVCDVDEFLEVDFTLGDATIVRTKGYDMVEGPPSRLGVENELMSKAVMFKRRAGLTEIGYNFGCHTHAPAGNVIYSEQTARLLHYKYVSPEYVFERHSAYEKRLSDLNKKYGWGHHYNNTTIEDVRATYEAMAKRARPLL